MNPLTPRSSSRTPAGRRAVFLDRDGTINVERDYLYRIEDFEFIDGAPEAIRRLKDAGFLVVVVTNQSGVARGYFGLEDVQVLHRHIQDELGKVGAAIDAFYVCPHHPSAGRGEFLADCSCRKGRPGMLLQAAAEHGLDLAGSFMVGDKLADIEAGLAAGCAPLLVKTGYGAEVAGAVSSTDVCVVEDISEAADRILACSQRSFPENI